MFLFGVCSTAAVRNAVCCLTTQYHTTNRNKVQEGKYLNIDKNELRNSCKMHKFVHNLTLGMTKQHS